MISHQVVKVLVTITLIEMMAATGLAVSLNDVLHAVRNWRRLLCAVAANYLLVPAVALLLVELLINSEGVAVGLLILAVFPGASYGPPFTAFARGDLSLAVGLMVLLAGSSAIVGPVLLHLLLLLTSVNASLAVDVPRVIETLALIQLLPLAVGLFVRTLAPSVANKLRKPAELASKILNGCSIACILITQGEQATAFHFVTLTAMAILLLASLSAGYLLGGAWRGQPKGNCADDVAAQCRRERGHRFGAICGLGGTGCGGWLCHHRDLDLARFCSLVGKAPHRPTDAAPDDGIIPRKSALSRSERRQYADSFACSRRGMAASRSR